MSTPTQIARRVAVLFTVVAAAVLTVACGDDKDARTEQVAAGIDRDSALKLLAAEIPGATMVGGEVSLDTMKNVWRRTQYLINGQNIEVLFYSPNNEKWKATDTVPEEKIIPVVLANGKVIGVGRSAYDSVAKAYNIPRNKY